jgi:hypothetical protein
MAYNNENRLKRIVEIQNIVLEHTKRGVSQKWVYENIIYPRFLISYSCFNDYLTINAKAELKRLQEQKEKAEEFEKKQLRLDL